MTPVLLTIMMTVTIEWIPKEETGDRLSVLVTLFLALYAHKYVLVQQINTLETTSLENVMLFGYVCMFCQAVVVVLSAPQPYITATTTAGSDGADNEGGAEEEAAGGTGPAILGPAFSFSAQVFLMLLMACSVALYTQHAERFAGRLRAMTAANETIVPEWLMSAAGQRTRRLLKR
jgi:cytochrome c biogenesis factor